MIKDDITGKRWSGTSRCPNGTCAEVEATPTGVKLTSTIPGAGEINYTGGEFAIFLEAAKAGELDHLL